MGHRDQAGTAYFIVDLPSGPDASLCSYCGAPYPTAALRGGHRSSSAILADTVGPSPQVQACRHALALLDPGEPLKRALASSKPWAPAATEAAEPRWRLGSPGPRFGVGLLTRPPQLPATRTPPSRYAEVRGLGGKKGGLH
ncbi:hypothetical protein NDU88_003461 [Pleurodeles waltl]|uniref:Uncharacterized protein n=1 Tax=Pleurodeles waltl TaxID=8319 RepID=A0AAV7T5V6_PLEWA|nr:hypothetical protein NDU88_003461 [Pleurodeles waltl]